MRNLRPGVRGPREQPCPERPLRLRGGMGGKAACVAASPVRRQPLRPSRYWDQSATTSGSGPDPQGGKARRAPLVTRAWARVAEAYAGTRRGELPRGEALVVREACMGE